MDDPEIEAIRNQRMQQMQQQYVSWWTNLKPTASLIWNLNFKDPENQEKLQQKQQQQTEMKHSMLAQLLDQNARARLNTLKISKPEKAEMVFVNFSATRLDYSWVLFLGRGINHSNGATRTYRFKARRCLFGSASWNFISANAFKVE